MPLAARLPKGQYRCQAGYSNLDDTSYYKDAVGNVTACGYIKRSSPLASGQVIGTLPVGFRPLNNLTLPGCVKNPQGPAFVIMTASGQIIEYHDGSGPQELVFSFTYPQGN